MKNRTLILPEVCACRPSGNALWPTDSAPLRLPPPVRRCSGRVPAAERYSAISPLPRTSKKNNKYSALFQWTPMQKVTQSVAFVFKWTPMQKVDTKYRYLFLGDTYAKGGHKKSEFDWEFESCLCCCKCFIKLPKDGSTSDGGPFSTIISFCKNKIYR